MQILDQQVGPRILYFQQTSADDDANTDNHDLNIETTKSWLFNILKSQCPQV